MSSRSPRYPRQSLWKSLDMVHKLFNGAHRAKVDVDAAARVIGYASSTGGAAASAIGALRQFGLVDGLRGEVCVSELAMRIIQPMDAAEKYQAVKEAASKPEIFGRVLAQFGGKLPGSDEPIRAYLIRNEGFSVSGATELISALKDTFNGLPPDTTTLSQDGQIGSGDEDREPSPATMQTSIPPQSSKFSPLDEANSNAIMLPLGSAGKVEIRFEGTLTSNALGRLIKHLELMREMLTEDQQGD